MPSRAFLFFSLVVVVTLGASGCGPAKLDEKRSWDVVPGDTQMLILPAQPKPQRITVEYESDQPVEVGIYKSEDVKEGAGLPTSKALAIDKAKAKGTLTADLYPDVSTTVTVSALGKQAIVKLHAHNKK